jgi:hypothetical protein
VQISGGTSTASTSGTGGDVGIDAGAGNLSNGANGAIKIGTLRDTIITMGTSTGSLTLNAPLTAGSTTFAPLKFNPAANLLTTPAAGSVEYDGEKAYLTPNSNTAGRGMMPAIHMVYATTTASIATTPVSPFAAANDTITLDAGRLYAFKATYLVNFTFTTTAQSMQTGFTFSNAPVGLMYTFKTYNQTGAAQSPFLGKSAVATATSVSASLGASGNYVIELEGMVKTNATTGGTLLPFIQLSGTGSTAVSQEFSSFQIVKLGVTGTANIAGNWA